MSTETYWEGQEQTIYTDYEGVKKDGASAEKGFFDVYLQRI